MREKTNPYKVIYQNGKPQYEHHLVAEKILGRKLDLDGDDPEQVHHLNFSEVNNDANNILILRKSQHTKLHNWIKKHGLKDIIIERAGTEGHLAPKRCLSCDDYLIQNEKFCDKQCQESYYDEFKNIPVSKEELAAMLDTMNKVEVAKKLNTNRSNIQAWEKKYGLV